MKEFLEAMEKDYMKEKFSKKEMVVYGILVPLALIALMALAGWLETGCE